MLKSKGKNLISFLYVRKKKRRLTGLYALRRLRRLGLRKTPVGASAFVVFCSATFFCARKNAAHFSLSGAKKRHIQPERYMQCALKFCGKIMEYKATKQKKNKI
jgi:hypothetical protein